MKPNAWAVQEEEMFHKEEGETVDLPFYTPFCPTHSRCFSLEEREDLIHLPFLVKTVGINFLLLPPLFLGASPACFLLPGWWLSLRTVLK